MLTRQNATTSSHACPPKSRFFKFTSSNIVNLGNYKTFLLQILIICYDLTIGSNEEVISYNFLILVTSKPRFFQVHYLKHRELEELQNLSLTDIDYFS